MLLIMTKEVLRVLKLEYLFLIGPSVKGVVLQTAIDIMPDGSRRFVTTIPKEGKNKCLFNLFQMK